MAWLGLARGLAFLGLIADSSLSSAFTAWDSGVRIGSVCILAWEGGSYQRVWYLWLNIFDDRNIVDENKEVSEPDWPVQSPESHKYELGPGRDWAWPQI